MIYRTYPVDVKQTAGAGVALDVKGMTDKWIQFQGTFSTTTLEIQITLVRGDVEPAAGDYITVTGSITAAAAIEVPQCASWIRINTVANSGSPSAVLRGDIGSGG